MADFDIDVRLFPWLWFEFSPNHLAVGRVGIEAEPSFELVVGHNEGSSENSNRQFRLKKLDD